MKKILLILITFILATIVEANANDLTGKWVGIVSTPWTSPYNVRFEFKEDGTYSSEALGPTCFANEAESIGTNCILTAMSALYYGSDGYNTKKRYEVKDGKGTITFYFGISETTNQAVIESATIRTTNNEGEKLQYPYLDLSITYKVNGAIRGPMKYTLMKVN